MPKYRQLHIKTIDSFDFNDMPDDFTRVSWLLLPLILDREGRGIYSMSWIKSKMYPLRDDVTIEKLEPVFDWFSKRKMIVAYESDGRKFFFIPTWKAYQTGTEREARSFLPAPDQLPTNSREGDAQHNTSQFNTSTTADADFSLPELYSKYIGEVPNMFVSDEITLYEKECKHEYLAPAFKEMIAKKDVRNKWQYVKAILDDWRKNGMKKADSKPVEQPREKLSVEEIEKLDELAKARAAC